MNPTTQPSTQLHAPGQWQRAKLQAAFSQQTLLGWVLRYSLAVATVAAAFGLRLALTAWVGPGLPTYVTFYPAVMTAALLGGLGPGVLATALTGLLAAYFVLLPIGWAIGSPVDRLGLVIFVGMGLFMSVVAELYRRNRQKAAAYDREASLRESQARLATFAAVTFEGIVESEAGRIVDCNEQLAWMLGYTVGELQGVEIASLIPPEDRDRVMLNIQQDRESIIEHAMLRKDGTRLIVEARGRPDSPGSARRHTAIRDITEQKRTEEEVRKLAMIVESSDDAIVSRNLDGIIVSWNGGAERMFGYLAAEAIGRPISILRPPGHPDDIPILSEKGTWGNKSEYVEGIRVRKDGKQIRILRTVSPIKDGSGTILGASVISRDITASKQMEEMFRQAQKMEAVGRLAGGVAHDFNNLLGVIIGYSEMILEHSDTDARVRQQCEEIKRAGDRAASLTRQLLAFSRQQVLEPKILNLNTSIVEIEKMLGRLIGEDIELRISLDPALGSVKADPGQIEQVIMNLAVNARDAMPEGGKLVIETRNAELDDEYAFRHPPCIAGSYVLLAVTDNGVGMTPEIKAQIFEPFFTTKEVGKGTGLGLSSVYGVVKQSGGYVWVYSEPGQGSVFKIYLPRVDGPEQRIRLTESAPEFHRGTETVLLVEDEQSLRTLTRNLLEQDGYAVLEANNGADALEIAKHHYDRIHLLLTDVVMPGMNGPALAEKILAIHPQAKTLYVSGYAGSFGTQTGLIPVGASLVQKPFSRMTLLQKVRNVLDVQKKSEKT